jgi:hypothetical protein
MPAAISPNSLPGWPHKDLAAEKVTLLACLLGWYGDKAHPLTGVFGEVMLRWELLRHDEALIELLTRQRSAPTNDDWKNDPVYSVLLKHPISHIVSTPGFPDPFLAIQEKDRTELVQLFTPEQLALEIGNIELLDAGGVLEQFQQLAKLAQEGRLYKRLGEQFKQDAIVRDENPAPGESLYYPIFKVRAHLGITAVRKGFEQWLDDNRKLFVELDSILLRQWEDPRPFLRDLAVMRLVKLYGYERAMAWTKEQRPRKRKGAVLTRDYERYFGEGKTPKGNRPLYERRRESANAVRRALSNFQTFRRVITGDPLR